MRLIFVLKYYSPRESYFICPSRTVVTEGILNKAELHGNFAYYNLGDKFVQIYRTMESLRPDQTWLKVALTLAIIQAIMTDIDEYKTDDECFDGIMMHVIKRALKKTLSRGYPPNHVAGYFVTEDSFEEVARRVSNHARRGQGFETLLYAAVAAIEQSPYVSSYARRRMRQDGEQPRRLSAYHQRGIFPVDYYSDEHEKA